MPTPPAYAPEALKALLRGPRHVQPEALNVAPKWVGARLATPGRRAAALGIDLLAVALLTELAGAWLVLGLLAVLWQLRGGRLAAPQDAPDTPPDTPPDTSPAPRRRAWAGWALAGLVALLAAQAVQERWAHWRQPAPTVSPLAAAAAASKAAARAAESAASAVPAEQVAALQAQVQALRAELRLARAQRPLTWREQFEHVLDDIGSALGWGIVYFSLLPAWWGGQTVGKKLLGLRIVELTGQPITVLRGLKRYGGYAAGMATGGLGFAQVLWDANRQGLHDKAAHTVVLDERPTPGEA